MQLISLHLRNFKGIRDFDFKPDGQNAEIAGENASGKTTLVDAFAWLLFNKDSQNRTDFEIKSIDRKTQLVKHNLEHEVSAVIFTDKEIELKKIYKEIWTRPRGTSAKQFTGHTSEYFIDGVPTPKSEYTKFISGIAPEETFRLLTDPRFFNEQMHWLKRREVLVNAFGDISDADIIASNSKLADLPAIVGDRTLDDHRKVVHARRSEINKELEKIPVRIDESSRDLPYVSDLNKKGLEQTTETLTTEIKEKTAVKSRIENGGQIAELKKKLAVLETEHIKRANEAQVSTNDRVREKQKQVNELMAQSDLIKNQGAGFTSQIGINEAQIIKSEKILITLREEWTTIKTEAPPTLTVETVCPACGQDLPEDQVHAAANKALNDFNFRKANRLAGNVETGKQVAGDIQQLKTDNIEFGKQVAGLENDKEGIEAQIDTLKAGIKKLEELRPVVTENPEITALKTEIEVTEAGPAAKIKVINEEIKSLETKRDDNADLLQDIKTCENAKVRISDLEKQEKDLAAEFEKLESELYLTDEFIRSKVGLLEKLINSQFKMAKFKLFDVQVNGGVSECCEVVKDGVPYSSMNNAARINMGLDIINTLSGVYDFTAPIFVDNAEAVVELFPVNAQVIRLTVSKKNKKLKVVIDKPKEVAIAA